MRLGIISMLIFFMKTFRGMMVDSGDCKRHALQLSEQYAVCRLILVCVSDFDCFETHCQCLITEQLATLRYDFSSGKPACV